MIQITHLEPAINPANDPYRRPRLDCPRPVEPEETVESTRDYYMIDKLLCKETSQGQTST